MSENKSDEKATGLDIAKEVTPGWEKLLYSDERKAQLAKGEINLRDYHAISGPEMLQMALIGFRMYEQGKYSEAKTIFSGLIQLEPTEAYYYTALGAVSPGRRRPGAGAQPVRHGDRAQPEGGGAVRQPR